MNKLLWYLPAGSAILLLGNIVHSLLIDPFIPKEFEIPGFLGYLVLWLLGSYIMAAVSNGVLKFWKSE